MPRDSKRARFSAHIAKGLSPLAAAKAAGFAQPKRFVESLSARATERELTAETDDRTLALRALRTACIYGEGTVQVMAAKALLDVSPPASTDSTQRAEVHFHYSPSDLDREHMERTAARARAEQAAAEAAEQAAAEERARTAEQTPVAPPTWEAPLQPARAAAARMTAPSDNEVARLCRATFGN